MASKPPHKKQRASVFASRIGFAFALVAATTAILAGVITYFVWSYQFTRYVSANLQDTAQSVAVAAADAYETYGGWNLSAFALIPKVGTRADVAVQILDPAGKKVYDEATLRLHALMLAEGDPSVIEDDAQITLDPTNETVMTAPVIVNDVEVGEVRVWAYGSGGLLTAHDLQMRLSSLMALGAAGFIAIIAATVAGAVYARRLVRPINTITETALLLREGDEGARTALTGDDEIAQLGMTFDKMADSIESDRLLERRLTSDVAHELRTPLMGIQATVEAIEDGIYPADNQHLSVISNETRRLARLTNAILELSRLENATEQFSMQRIDSIIPVSASIDLHSALLEASELSFKTNLTEGLFITADSDKLQQAVGNFLSNAARYTPEGGTVVVSTYAEEGQCIISIADTGIGISTEDKEKLFSRFWRADAARNRATGGIGVGLAIAKEIIERHKGYISVESTVGQGTTFFIHIPLALR